jgi:hypothetical protein
MLHAALVQLHLVPQCARCFVLFAVVLLSASVVSCLPRRVIARHLELAHLQVSLTLVLGTDTTFTQETAHLWIAQLLIL